MDKRFKVKWDGKTVQHTPGEWCLELPTPPITEGGPDYGETGFREDVCIRKGSAVRDAEGRAPGTYYVGDLIVLQENCEIEDVLPRILADARLIHAAPDLLAALQAYANKANWLSPDGSRRDAFNGGGTNAWDIASAAIAKATREE